MFAEKYVWDKYERAMMLEMYQLWQFKWWFPSSLMPWHHRSKHLAWCSFVTKNMEEPKMPRYLRDFFLCVRVCLQFSLGRSEKILILSFLYIYIWLKPGTWYILYFVCKGIGSLICSCLRYNLHLMSSYTLCTVQIISKLYQVRCYHWTSNPNDPCSFE